MNNMVFRRTPGQLRSIRVGTVVLAAVSGLAAFTHYWFGVVGFGALCLFYLWVSIASPRAFTECSPDGIRTQGIFGLVRRCCPWAEVDKISVVVLRYSKLIRVTRRDGSSFALSAPASSVGFVADRDFRAKFEQITSYWREAASGVRGRAWAP